MIGKMFMEKVKGMFKDGWREIVLIIYYIILLFVVIKQI